MGRMSLAVDVLHLLELMGNALLAFAAARAEACEPLKVLKGLCLVSGHKVLDHLVSHALALAQNPGDRLLIRIIKAFLLKIVINCSP